MPKTARGRHKNKYPYDDTMTGEITESPSSFVTVRCRMGDPTPFKHAHPL